MEHWDDYQLKSVSFEFGGSKPFFDLLQDYKIQGLGIKDKYSKLPVMYYLRKHQAALEGKEFTELTPAKDWNEVVVRA